MRDVGKIIYIYENKFRINRQEFYDNLKLSLKYNGQDDEYGIYASGTKYFKNAILEILEQLNKHVYVYLEGQQHFKEIEDFFKWIYSKENLELGIESHKKFIDNAYNIIKEKGIY